MLALLLLGAAAPEAWSADQAVTGLTATQVFEIATQADRAGDVATAQSIYEALAKDPSVEVRSEARFRHSQLLAQQKRYADAAVLLRAILDEQPDAQRVRLDLANVMALAGDERGAYRTLRQAQAGPLPPEIAAAVDQFAEAMRSRKPVGASLEFSLAPDSNINRATSASTLDTIIAPLLLSEDAQQQSGVGMKISGQTYGRLALSETKRLVGRVSGQATVYDVSAFNDTAGSIQVGWEATSGPARWSPAIGQTYRWYGGALYAVTDTASLNWRRSLGPTSQLEMDLATGRNRYKSNDLQSGESYSATLGFERALSMKSGFGVTVSGERQTARDPGYATRSSGLGLVYWREAGQATLFGSMNARRLDADERLLLFPERRSETYWRLGAGATFRQIKVRGFSPVVRLTHERNKSTVGIYDYTRNAVDFAITRAF